MAHPSLTQPKALATTVPPFASPWALPVFCGDRLQRLNVQRLLRHHLFQPPVFVFQLAKLLHVADFKSRISDATFYKWRTKYAGLEVSDVKKLRQLEDENRRLKQMVAEQALDIQALKAVTAKNW